MGGKFSNVSFNNSFENINKLQKEKLKNPYYAYSKTTKSLATYYHVNQKKSTLDEGTKQPFSHVGSSSPIRYDKINNMALYGFNKPQIELELGEFGLNAPIDGDCFILPNVLDPPIPNSYFSIELIDKKLLFKVTNVTPNVIENDNVIYRINYSLDSAIKSEQIEKQVVNEYDYIDGNISNNWNHKLVDSKSARYAKQIEDWIYKLRFWYIDLFYNNKLECFLFEHGPNYVYDEYLIEFIIRNNIISPNESGIYINHQTNISKTFSIDYEKTLFRMFEKNRSDIENYILKAGLSFIDDIGSTLSNRYYEYFRMVYMFDGIVFTPHIPVLSILENDLIYHIETHKEKENSSYENIIIKYINKTLDFKDLDNLDNIQPEYDKEYFYILPILIFILRKLSNSITNNQNI